jgi:hypothetical protein
MRIIVSLLLTLQLFTAWGQNKVPAVDTSVKAETTAVDSGRVTKSAGTQYAASGWKKMWWGVHYRREWVTPVSFPILHISTAYGGLKPLKAGGGHETKTLRLISSDGKEYVLRTVDKSADVLVPDYLKGTAINDLVNDQISTANPYAPLAVPGLADALQLMHANPQIYFVADDPSFGEFGPVFANRLCLLEERPSGKGWDHTAAFGNADDIVNTDGLLEKVFASSKNQVDQQAFLKVRLFDMILNDWDRHEDQWVWALHERNKENVYAPIGRDRDEAFTKTDGIALWVLCRPWGLRPLKNFTPTVKDVKGINFSARNLDRQFLNETTKEQWTSTINSVQAGLSDQAIENAVKAMPPEANQYSGKTIVKRLKERRDNLSHFGMKYYSTLAHRVTINGSAKDESFIINVMGNKEISITGLHGSSQDTFYHRSFFRNETKEINIYGLQGQDQFIVRGNEKNPFTIRVIGGDGKNEYKSEADKISGKKIKVYDSLLTDNIAKKTFKDKKWDTLYNYRRNSVKYDYYIPLIIPGYNVDDGFSIGLGILYRKQTWGKTPYGWSQQFMVNYATATQAVGFEYAGLFKQTFGKLDFDLNAFFRGPRYTYRFYGYGNETELNGKNRSFFKVKANDFYVSPGISRTWTKTYFRLGVQYEAVEVLEDPTKYLTPPLPTQIDSSIFSVNHFIGVNGKWNLFTPKDLRDPKNGWHLTAGFSYLNNMDKSTDQLKLHGSIGFYYTFFKRLTLAHRTGGEANFGKYFFYHAATIGMEQTLRGFWKSRFTGENSLYQNTELRLHMANLRGYYFRGKLGMFGFLDDARVWIDGEQSSTLHVGYGGGIYYVPYNLISLNLFYAASKETSMVTLRAGFFF